MLRILASEKHLVYVQYFELTFLELRPKLPFLLQLGLTCVTAKETSKVSSLILRQGFSDLANFKSITA